MRAIWIMLSNCTDPARDAEYNEWYNKMHIPDLTATPGVLSGQRYKNLRPQLAPDEPLYLALYTVEWEDPWALLRKVAWVDDKRRAEQGRMIDCLLARLLSSWQPLGTPQFAPGKQGTARLDKDVPDTLIIVLGNPAEGVAAGDFEKWFGGSYLPGLLKMPGLVWGAHYRTLRPNLKPGDCRYLAVLATDSKDSVGLLGRIDATSAGNKGKLQMSYSSAFKHVGP